MLPSDETFKFQFRSPQGINYEIYLKADQPSTISKGYSYTFKCCNKETTSKEFIGIRSSFQAALNSLIEDKKVSSENIMKKMEEMGLILLTEGEKPKCTQGAAKVAMAQFGQSSPSSLRPQNPLRF